MTEAELGACVLDQIIGWHIAIPVCDCMVEHGEEAFAVDGNLFQINQGQIARLEEEGWNGDELQCVLFWRERFDWLRGN